MCTQHYCELNRHLNPHSIYVLGMLGFTRQSDEKVSEVTNSKVSEIYIHLNSKIHQCIIKIDTTNVLKILTLIKLLKILIQTYGPLHNPHLFVLLKSHLIPRMYNDFFVHVRCCSQPTVNVVFRYTLLLPMLLDTCGGSSRLIKFLNRLGACASKVMHSLVYQLITWILNPVMEECSVENKSLAGMGPLYR